LSSVRKPDKRRTRKPLDSLSRLAAKRGVTQHDVARHAGVNQPTVNGTFRRDRLGSIPAGTRTRYLRAIDAAAAERDSIAGNAAAWLRDEIAAGRLPKKLTADQLRRVAAIVRSAVLVAGASGAKAKAKANGR